MVSPRSLGYVLTLFSFDMTPLIPSVEQKEGEVVPENMTADPVRAKVTLLSILRFPTDYESG